MLVRTNQKGGPFGKTLAGNMALKPVKMCCSVHMSAGATNWVFGSLLRAGSDHVPIKRDQLSDGFHGKAF